MKTNNQNRKAKNYIGKVLIFAIVLVFAIFGITVFLIAQKTTREMSNSAINNLSESLDLMKGTVEMLLKSQQEFQEFLATELSDEEDLEKSIQNYDITENITNISVIVEGRSVGVSCNGDEFCADDLDFSTENITEEVEISKAYLNHMGAWAYTIKCPVVKDDKKIATLYMEYIYDEFDGTLPDRPYSGDATLYIMDAQTQRFVLKPKGVGARVAGHINLEDFYRANVILEDSIQEDIAKSIQLGENYMFYHKILNEKSLIYLWSVNGGTLYLVGYVPLKAIQREGSTVNQNIFIVVAVMLTAFVICFAIYFITQRQQRQVQKERELEREIHNKELSKALQNAQIANNAKTVFLSNMSHDIRTPMNAVLGFTSLLEQEADNPTKVREYVKKIKFSSEHLLELINEVLDITKIESGKNVLILNEFSIKQMVFSVENIIRQESSKKNQNLSISIENITHDVLLGDVTKINQICVNLLSNAVKYTQEQGNIWFNIIGMEQHSPQYQSLRIVVKDDGYGMSQDFLKILFDPFTRAENSTTNKVQGTGLGMAITKNLVELMDGTIKVISEINKGTTFTIDLELRIPDGSVVVPEDTTPNVVENILLGKNFLIAEDNEINAEIIVELLKLEGATCEIVSNGELAVKRFESSKLDEFDAIFMDIQMPVMNGYEATKIIRHLDKPNAKTIPIIAMTANAFSEDIKDALNVGMNAHISKPINMSMLKNTVGKYL